jgi:hypothetical protein
VRGTGEGDGTHPARPARPDRSSGPAAVPARAHPSTGGVRSAGSRPATPGADRAGPGPRGPRPGSIQPAGPMPVLRARILRTRHRFLASGPPPQAGSVGTGGSGRAGPDQSVGPGIAGRPAYGPAGPTEAAERSRMPGMRPAFRVEDMAHSAQVAARFRNVPVGSPSRSGPPGMSRSDPQECPGRGPAGRVPARLSKAPVGAGPARGGT